MCSLHNQFLGNAFQTKSGYSKLFFFQQNLEKKREIVEGPQISLKKAICAEISDKNTIFQKNMKFY